VETSSSIIEDISKRSQSQRSTAIAYYYFDFNDEGKRDADSLHRALLTQLLPQCPNDASCLAALDAASTRSSGADFLSRTLQAFIRTFEDIYIIIDALDECSEVEELMKFVGEICNWDAHQLHLLAASRQLPEIEEAIADCATDRVCLHESKTRADIAMFIEQRLNTDRKFLKWPDDIRAEIQSALSHGAGGMWGIWLIYWWEDANLR
jgi:hypothetical protein